MFRMQCASGSEPRRGVILMVVLFLLTLMAVVGLSFVLYANSEAAAARLYRDAQSSPDPDVEPELLLSFFLSQLLFDTPDDGQGVYSGLRGHSLARNMFGLNYTFAPDGRLVPFGNDVPFNGTGRLRFPSLFPGVDDSHLINYTYFADDGFLRDPERYGPRPGLRPIGTPDNRTPFWGGANAPYTYPDLNNLFLAAAPADGRLLLPSFHRPWLFGRLTDIPNFPPGNPGNPNWTNRQGKYLLLRPRPVDMGPGFPYPEDEGGDVKNLIGSRGYYDPFTGRIHQNDSVWIDLDAPVLTANDGRKYKALFAPLVLDLDNRVNLNVAGNLRGLDGNSHASNMGWGPWEVNPGRVLRGTSPPEWPALLRGSRFFGGRFGLDNFPHSPLPGNQAGFPGLPRFYAPVDYDGAQELASGAPSDKLRLPGTMPALPYQCFPAATGGYGNASAFERVNHPSLYNSFRPWAPDRQLSLANQEALLRHGDTGSQAFASELVRLCPNTFTDRADPAGAARRRRLVTLHSSDPDRPGVTPWFWPSTPLDYNRLPPLGALTSPSPHPVGVPVASPPAFLPDHPESEFGPDGRASARITAMRRIDLNRYLPPYPAPNATGVITDESGFAVAQRSRQYLAAEVFECLWKVTGAGNPGLLPLTGADLGRGQARRWLAQLAVNIVDFIDADDYLTPFHWGPGPADRVFGTELPRVVINEAYVEHVNVPNDPGLAEMVPQATVLKANVWVELHNSMRDDPPGSGLVPLDVPGSSWGSSYRLILARSNSDLLRQPDNVLGEPAPYDVLSVLSTFRPVAGAVPPPLASIDTRVLLPSDPSGGGYSAPPGENKGFYVVGPLPGSPQDKIPFPPAMETLRRPEMSYLVPINASLMQPSVLLQRLACPYRPPQPNPLMADFNPFVTVDYLPGVPANRAWEVGAPGLSPGQPVTARHSTGRKQPYAAHPSQLRRQQPLPPLPDQPQHTFFQHNADAATPGPNWRVPPANYPPFDWLVHLDRPLVSPPELLHVSAFKPHELTQQFMTGDTDPLKFTHRAPWLDERLVGVRVPLSHRLYRALEFLGTHGRTAGTTSTRALAPLPNQVVVPAAMSGTTPTGGTWRIEAGSSVLIDGWRANEEVVFVKAVDQAATPPTWFAADFLRPHTAGCTITPATVSERLPGKINLNTVWDEETFVALCDPNPANHFNGALARVLFRQLKASRTVGGDTPGPNDRPFRSLAAGTTPASDAQWPNGGLQDTLLRFKDPNDPQRLPLLAVPGQPHPHQTFELLTKIFNSTTVRSNVFAVWLTVGFFEVIDDTTRPVKLGAELGRSERRHVRHRMFAIVDRSVLIANPGPQRQFDPRSPPPRFSTGPVVPYLSIID